MSTFTELLSQPLAERLGWALVHFLWQGALVACLLVAVLRILRAASAEARYLAGCAALAVMAGLPVVTLLCLPARVPSTAPSPVAMEIPIDRPISSDLVVVEPFAVTDGDTTVSETPMAAVPVSSSEFPLSNAPAEVAVSWAELVNEKLRPLIPWFVAAWLAGVLFLSLRLLVSWRSAQRMRLAGTSAASDRLISLLSQIAEQFGVRQAIDLLESTAIEVPAAIGWFRPVILLPVSAITGLTESQIKAILAHELAHIRRCDYLVNLGQSVVETLLFYHPAVWWVSSQIRQEREHCCDDLAGAICGDRVGYAQALVRMEELRSPAGNVALAASGGRLTDRVRRLLGVHNRDRVSAWWLGGAMAMVVAATIVTGLWWTSAVEAGAASSEVVTTDDDAEKPDANGAPALAGRVTDESGQPVSGASVRLQVAPRRWRWQDDPPVVIARAHTDSEGIYQLSLPDGWQKYEPFYQKQVNLWVSASEGRLGLISINRTVLRKLQNLKDPIPSRRDLDVTVTSEQLPLRVVSPSGMALADATVMAVHGHGRQTPKDLCHRTDADGGLVLPLVAGHPISEFWVISKPFGIQLWQRPEDVLAARQENMPAELKLKPVTRLSGKIDMPSRDVALDGRLIATTWGHLGNINEEPRGYARIVPDANGTYEIPTIVAGLLSFHHEYQREQYPSERQKWPWFLRAPQRMEVELKPDSPFAVDLAIESGTVIRGRLLGAGSRPLPYASFLVHHGPQDRSDRYAESIKLATDQDGRFEARVMAGPITIRGDAGELELADVTFVDPVYEEGEVTLNIELKGEVTINFESTSREAKPKKGTETEDSPAAAPEEDTTDADDQDAPWRVRLRAIDATTGKTIPDAEFVVQWDKKETAYESDDKGEFVAEVPTRTPRNCCLKCRADGYASMRALWTNSESGMIDELPAEWTFLMEKAVSVGGIILNDAGEPVPGATVMFTAIDLASAESGRRIRQFTRDEYQTDAKGRWVCPSASLNMDFASIRIEHPDYARDRTIWGLKSRLEALREQSLTLYLHKGYTLRGRVRDPEGNPVEDVVLMQEISPDPNDDPFFRTDVDGRFSIPRASLRELVVVKPGFAPVKRELADKRFWYPFEPAVMPEKVDDILIQLERAAKVTLRVTDTDGQPVPGARIVPCFNEWGPDYFLDSLYQRAEPNPETDGNGTWTWDSAPKGDKVYYSVFKSGYTGIVQYGHTTVDDAEVEVTLRRSRSIHGEVVDAVTRQPVNDCVVQESRLSGQSERLQASVRAHNGQYRIVDSSSPVKGHSYRYRVLAEGYEPVVSDPVKYEEGEVTVDFELKPRKAEPEKVTESKEPPAAAAAKEVSPDPLLTVRIHDQATGKPIEKFLVVPGTQAGGYGHNPFSGPGGVDMAAPVIWQPQLITEGAQGLFQWPADRPLRVLRLRFEADGYIPELSPWIKKSGGKQNFDVGMRRDPGITGQVLTPDGRPAAGAVLAVTMNHRMARLEGGKFVGIDDRPPAKLIDRWQRPIFARADSEGRYRLGTEVGPVTVYAVHESGIAEVPFTVVQEAGEICLQRWAALDGHVVWVDKPGANEEFLLSVKRDLGDFPESFSMQTTVTTNAQGRFHVDKLPPWTVKVSRRFELPEDRGEYLYPSQEFELAEGKSTGVVFGGRGRPVVGKLIGLKPGEEVTIQIEPFTPDGPRGHDNWLARALVYQSSFGPVLFRTKIPVAEDGTFRIDNVLPADYQLRMKGPSLRVFAASRFTIEPMPDGESDESLDLGEIQVKRR